MEFIAANVILSHVMYYRITLSVTFWIHVCKLQQKSIRGTFLLLVFSARYFIMKCNNQRNLDISMAKVTIAPYIYLVNYIFIF